MTTPAQFVTRYGSEEIARRAAPEGTAVSGALLEATLNEDDRSAWTADEQSAADTALGRIQTALVEAEGIVHGSLPAPLSPIMAVIADGWIGKVARYNLYDDNRPDYIRQDYEDFMAWIKAQQSEGGVQTVRLVRS